MARTFEPSDEKANAPETVKKSEGAVMAHCSPIHVVTRGIDEGIGAGFPEQNAPVQRGGAGMPPGRRSARESEPALPIKSADASRDVSAPDNRSISSGTPPSNRGEWVRR